MYLYLGSDISVPVNEIIGIFDIEKVTVQKYMNDYLSGTKGYETLYVDSVGNTIAKGDSKNATSGNDVYLSIDMELQKATYILLEQEIAGILYSKIAGISGGVQRLRRRIPHLIPLSRSSIPSSTV